MILRLGHAPLEWVQLWGPQDQFATVCECGVHEYSDANHCHQKLARIRTYQIAGDAEDANAEDAAMATCVSAFPTVQQVRERPALQNIMRLGRRWTPGDCTWMTSQHWLAPRWPLCQSSSWVHDEHPKLLWLDGTDVVVPPPPRTHDQPHRKVVVCGMGYLPSEEAWVTLLNPVHGQLRDRLMVCAFGTDCSVDTNDTVCDEDLFPATDWTYWLQTYHPTEAMVLCTNDMMQTVQCCRYLRAAKRWTLVWRANHRRHKDTCALHDPRYFAAMTSTGMELRTWVDNQCVWQHDCFDAHLNVAVAVTSGFTRITHTFAPVQLQLPPPVVELQQQPSLHYRIVAKVGTMRNARAPHGVLPITHHRLTVDIDLSTLQGPDAAAGHPFPHQTTQVAYAPQLLTTRTQTWNVDDPNPWGWRTQHAALKSLVQRSIQEVRERQIMDHLNEAFQFGPQQHRFLFHCFETVHTGIVPFQWRWAPASMYLAVLGLLNRKKFGLNRMLFDRRLLRLVFEF